MTTFQHDQPLFVRDYHYPLKVRGIEYRYNKPFPWREIGLETDQVQILYDIGRVYHNPELEKTTKTGDRLVEFDSEMLGRLVNLVNNEIVKKSTTSKEEFTKYKIKQSKIDDKQRGLVRSWLNRNGKNHEWVEGFYKYRDQILGD